MVYVIPYEGSTEAQGHRVIVNGVMMGEVLKQHYTELGRLVYLEASV